MAKNLFAKATTKKAPKKSKTDKRIVNISGKEFAKKLQEYAILKDQLDDIKASFAMAQSEIKTRGIEEYAKLVNLEKNDVGSFVITSDNDSSVMFLPTKKYIKIDEVEAERLTTEYGENIINEETAYGFNAEILMRNMEAISEALLNGVLSDEDTENLIVATTTQVIKKDTLDKVYILAQESENSISDVLDDIQPVYQLKNASIGKIEKKD
jgi:hypothetical protein